MCHRNPFRTMSTLLSMTSTRATQGLRKVRLLLWTMADT